MEYKTVLTICGYCGCGCGLYLEVLDGELVGTLPCKTDPVSQGGLCIKGWNLHEFVNNSDRLTKPLIKKEGQFREATWDEALDHVASRLKELKRGDGVQDGSNDLRLLWMWLWSLFGGFGRGVGGNHAL